MKKLLLVVLLIVILPIHVFGESISKTLEKLANKSRMARQNIESIILYLEQGKGLGSGGMFGDGGSYITIETESNSINIGLIKEENWLYLYVGRIVYKINPRTKKAVCLVYDKDVITGKEKGLLDMVSVKWSTAKGKSQYIKDIYSIALKIAREDFSRKGLVLSEYTLENRVYLIEIHNQLMDFYKK